MGKFLFLHFERLLYRDNPNPAFLGAHPSPPMFAMNSSRGLKVTLPQQVKG